jgi:sulfotransferase
MTEKTYYFMSGLPRSGSTLLSEILNQNSNLYTTHNSPVLNMMIQLSNFSINDEMYLADPKPDDLQRVMSSVIFNYHYNNPSSIIIDKNRGWVGHIDVVKKYITNNVKIICTYRDPLECVASFLKLLQQNKYPSGNVFDKEGLDNDYKRCAYIFNNSILKQSADNIITGIQNYPECILLIEYDDLINNTKKVIKKIYNFLDLDYYEHDLNLKPKNTVNDSVYKLDGMHTVRPIIKKTSVNPIDIIPKQIVEEYKQSEYYKNFNNIVSNHSKSYFF